MPSRSLTQLRAAFFANAYPALRAAAADEARTPGSLTNELYRWYAHNLPADNHLGLDPDRALPPISAYSIAQLRRAYWGDPAQEALALRDLLGPTPSSPLTTFPPAAGAGGGGGGGAGARPVLPAIANLVFHLDAYDLADAGVADGGAVPVWADAERGRNFDLPTIAGFTAPTLRHGGIGGRPAVEFMGTQGLGCGNLPLGTGRCTVLIGYQGTLAARSFFMQGANANENNFEGHNTGVWRAWAGAALEAGGADLEPHIFSVVYNGTSSLIRIDGVQVAAGSTGWSGATAGRLSLSQGTFPLNGRIAQVVHIDRIPTTAELAEIEAALAPHYGINLA
jgi:hypothetical protein